MMILSNQVKASTKPVYDLMRDGITQSMIQTWMQCPKRFDYTVNGWETLGQPSSNILYGELMHLFLDKHYSCEMSGKKSTESLQEIANSWRKAYSLVEAQTLEDVISLACIVFPLYVECWLPKDACLRWVGLEIPFDVSWGGYRLRGKVDGCFTYDGDKVWILETKTKAQMDEDTISECLTFDFQNLFYTTCLASLGFTVVGCLYNLIRYPQIRQKSGESGVDYEKRLHDDIRKRTDFYFKRFEVPYTEEALKMHQRELVIKLQEISSALKDPNLIYHRETSCIGRGKCPFLSACSSGSLSLYSQTRKLFRELEA